MIELRLLLLLAASTLLTGCASFPPSKQSNRTTPQTYAERKQAIVADFEKQRDAAQVHAAVNAWQRGEPEEAHSLLAGVVQRSPQDFNAKLRFAELLAAQEETSAAEVQLRECLALAPDSAEVHHALGLLLSDLSGREAESQNYLRRASELEPENTAYAAVAE